MSGAPDRGRDARALEEARVFEFMHSAIVTCASSTPLDELAERMATRSIHCVVVLPEFGDDGLEHRWVVATDLDLVRAAARGQPGLTAGEIATGPIASFDRNERMLRAAELMAEHDSAHLMVSAHGRDRPVGIVSTLDVARCLAPGVGTLLADLHDRRPGGPPAGAP
jgi:CBS domain-containing protein